MAEAPGQQEEAKGRILIGKTGQELNEHYLPLAGLRREEVTCVNAIRCLPVGNGGKIDLKQEKNRALLQCCAETFLYPLIEKMQPSLLLPLGAFACRAIDPGINLELQHGMPVETRLGLAFVQYHPAQGLHEPKKMLMLRTDWQRLRSYRNGNLLLPQDDYPDPDYREADEDDIEALDPTKPLAGDTEFNRKRDPFCLTFTQHPGSGRLIRADNSSLLQAFATKTRKWEHAILFHNWLADQPITEKMGLHLPPHRIVDTMVRVFHLGNLPQGLKALAYRELGMVMQDFEDLVKPYSEQLVLRYYRQAYTVDWPKPEPTLIRGDDGRWKVYKEQGMNTKLKRFFTDYGKNPEKDVFKMWEENWEEQQTMIEAECGEWPGLSIEHAPFDEIVQYACRDVDALIRLYPIIQRMTRFVRKYSQDQWRKKAA